MAASGSTGIVATLERAGEVDLDHLQEQAVAVVIVGRFEPADFDVDGLIRRKLIPGRRRPAARVEVMHPELARLSAIGLTFDVTRDRVMISARAEPFVRLMDVVKATSEHLVDEELVGLVFAYAFQFRVDDLRQQRELGRRLAPMDVWGPTAELFEGAQAIPGGGLASLTLQQTVLDAQPGTLKITVQPSHPTSVGPGVSMQIERSFARTERSRGAPWFAQACIDQYDPTLRMCKGIVRGMIDHAKSL